jgi:hypothetical protein
MDITGLPIPLKRTGAAVDRIFALPIEALGDWVERQFKSNLESHVEAVRTSRGRRGKKIEIEEANISIEKVKSVHEWSEKAKEIDADDVVLSAAWRAALDQLLDNDGAEDDLLRRLTALPNATMRYFFEHYGKRTNIFGNSVGNDRSHAMKLEEAGLANPMLDIRWTILVGIVIVFVMMLRPSRKPCAIGLRPCCSSISLTHAFNRSASFR